MLMMKLAREGVAVIEPMSTATFAGSVPGGAAPDRGALQDQLLLRSQRAPHLRRQHRAAEHLQVGVHVDVGPYRRVDHPLDGHDRVGLLELHRGPRREEGRGLHLAEAVADRDQQGQRQRDPRSLPQDDHVVAERPALGRVLAGVQGRGRTGLAGVFGHRVSDQISFSGT
jgi:hypothetical protein